MVSIGNINLGSEEGIGPLMLSNAISLELYNCLGLSTMLEDMVINSVGCFTSLKSLTIRSCNGNVWQEG